MPIIHLAVCVKVTARERGDDSESPPEVVSEPQQRQRSFTWQIKSNVPHFNLQNYVTGPNNSNVVPGSVFGNLCTENINTWKSLILSVLQTLCHMSFRLPAGEVKRDYTEDEIDVFSLDMYVLWFQSSGVFVESGSM